MSLILNESELVRFVREGVVIRNGDEKCAEGLKYDFRLGNRFLKAGQSGEKTFEQLDSKNEAFVETGEVVFVMTLERLEIPKNMKVSLYDKRKMSHDGINLLGGRSVDPGYNGYLIFGIHNVSGRNFPLKPGRKLIGAEFHRLEGDEIVSDDSKVPTPIEDFPDDIEKMIEVYKPLNPETITKKLEEIQTGFNTDKINISVRLDNMDRKLEKISDKVDDLGTTAKLDSKAVKNARKILIGVSIAVIAGIVLNILSTLGCIS